MRPSPPWPAAVPRTSWTWLSTVHGVIRPLPGRDVDDGGAGCRRASRWAGAGTRTGRRPAGSRESMATSGSMSRIFATDGRAVGVEDEQHVGAGRCVGAVDAATVMVTVPPAWVNARSWKFWSLLNPCVTDPLRTSVTRETGAGRGDLEVAVVADLLGRGGDLRARGRRRRRRTGRTGSSTPRPCSCAGRERRRRRSSRGRRAAAGPPSGRAGRARTARRPRSSHRCSGSQISALVT